MSPIDERRIDKAVLKPEALKVRKRLDCDPGKWNDYEIEQIRSACGPKWANVSIANIRSQCEDLRKSGELGTVGDSRNHGATIRPEPPPWYKEYLTSDHWQHLRRFFLTFWDYKCAWCSCPDTLEVHHRNYDRLKEERLQDCIVLCKCCHNAATRQQERAKKTAAANKQMELLP